MIACDSCGVANMADSRFCRNCGAQLAAPTAHSPSDEDLKMVHDAQRLFGEGRYDEASVVATAIIEGDPFCINALAIKGDCHERLGEYAEALQCYRDILKIQPESQLDRIRVARLEKIVSSGEIEIGKPAGRRRTALGAAVAAAILLVSSGSALILAAQQPTDAPTQQAVDGDGAQSNPFLPVPFVPGNTNYAPNQQSAPQNMAYDGIQSTGGGTGINPLVTPGGAQRIAPGALPDVPRGQIDPMATNRVNPDDVRPVKVDVDPGVAGSRQGPPGDPDPTVVSGNGGNSGNRDVVVDVRPSQGTGSGSATGNTQVDDRAVRVEQLIRVAREKQILGDFAKAADAYEKALALGASPASTNQRLAQCYTKLGKKAEAVKAYERAISAFEKMDQNDVRVQAQLEACRAELKQLRGN